MGETFRLDPDGDVILILRNPNAPFAAWDERQDYMPLPLVPARRESPPPIVAPCKKSKGKKARSRLVAETETEPDIAGEFVPAFLFGRFPDAASEALEFQADPDHDHEPANIESSELLEHDTFSEQAQPTRQADVRMQVSSRHLILASAYFKRMFGNDWKETCSVDGRFEIFTENWDSDALLILMNIIHGHTRNVKRTISLEMLTKLAVLVDYYQCAEVVEIFSEIWINQLNTNLPATYSRDLILWLCISWVFRQPYQFKAATYTALKQSQGLIRTLGLPIPKIIVGKLVVILENVMALITCTERINQERLQSIDQIISALHKLLDDFYERRKLYSFECNSILLGALTSEMRARGLFSPRPAIPFLGFSLATTMASVRDIRSPRWHIKRNSPFGPEVDAIDCSLEPLIYPIVDGVEKSMNGLALEDFLSKVDSSERRDTLGNIIKRPEASMSTCHVSNPSYAWENSSGSAELVI